MDTHLTLTETQVRIMETLWEIGSVLPDNFSSKDLGILFAGNFIRWKGGDEVKLTTFGANVLWILGRWED